MSAVLAVLVAVLVVALVVALVEQRRVARRLLLAADRKSVV